MARAPISGKDKISLDILTSPTPLPTPIQRQNVSFLWPHYFTLKGKLGDFFLLAQSFYRPKTKTSFNRQFSPKSPKIGQKSGQRVQNSPNKDQVASDLLWESINSVLRPTVGIHQFCPPTYCGNPFFTNSATNLLWESINSVLRPTVGIHQFCPPSYCGNPLEYIQQLSDIIGPDLQSENIN